MVLVWGGQGEEDPQDEGEPLVEGVISGPVQPRGRWVPHARFMRVGLSLPLDSSNRLSGGERRTILELPFPAPGSVTGLSNVHGDLRRILIDKKYGSVYDVGRNPT